MPKVTGAGIIPVLDNTQLKYTDLPKDYLYLILVDKKGRYDFPKGCIDPDEYAFDCALRESNEEANLKYKNFTHFHSEHEDKAFKCGEGLHMFLGYLSDISNIRIKMNPKLPIYEHEKFMFLTYKDILDSKLLYGFLIPALKEAHDIVKQS